MVTQGKYWCVTSYNLNDYENWKLLNNEKINYLVYQVEICPKTNKKHIQGYIEYNSATTMQNIKKIMKNNKLHVEYKRGTRNEAREYCMKTESKDNDYETVEIGYYEIKEQGKRNDLLDIYDMIKSGVKLDEVAEAYPAHYIRYHKGIKEVKNLIECKKLGEFKNIEVNVLYGKAGTGKTSYIYDKHGPENCYKLEKGNGDNLWFDGYSGQKVLIIDDFYGWIKYGKMLNLLDGYKMLLEIKGGTVCSNWDYVYITSNDSPDLWYKKGFTDAIKRRINNIYNMKEIGKLYKENIKWNLCKKILSDKIEYEIIEEIEEKTENIKNKSVDCLKKLPGNTSRQFHGPKNPEKTSWKTTIENAEKRQLSLRERLKLENKITHDESTSEDEYDSDEMLT